MAKPTLTGLVIWDSFWFLLMIAFPSNFIIFLSIIMMFAEFVDFIFEGK